MVTTARAAQRRLYFTGRSSEQTGKGQDLFMRVFRKRHPEFRHRRFRIDPAGR